MTRKCRHCKNTFKIKRINQYYCSQSCRQKAYLLRNGFSKEKTQAENPATEDLLKNISGSVNPELMQGILSVLNGKTSMTDLFAKTQEKPTNEEGTTAEPNEESVNDAKPKNKGIMQEFFRKRMLSKRNPDEKSAFMEAKNENVVQKTVIMEKKSAIMEDSCRNHGEVMQKKTVIMEDSCEKDESFMRESCDKHVSSMSKVCDKYGSSMEKPEQKDVFSYMVAQKYTLPIGPKGFVRLLFPNWNDKEWKISCLVNDRFLTVIDRLLKGSMKERIKTSVLHDCMKELYEIIDGIIGIMLPTDYPFTKFIQYVKSRLATVVQNAGKKEEIKFRLSEELSRQMSIVSVQIRVKGI